MPHDSEHKRDGERPEADKPLGRDERVSFYPMDPEEVLRKLLRTPPPIRRSPEEPSGDDRDGA